jgi:AraC-like DNA-binding protein
MNRPANTGPETRPDSGPDTDRLLHWLIDSVELDATVFHLGQYCGNWRASTAGRALASFHLVVHGRTWLHIEGHDAILLGARDGAFLLRDLPHFLSPDPDPGALVTRSEMQPLGCAAPDSVGLACGFFQFRGAVSSLIVDAFPDFLILRGGDAALRAAASLFDLIMLETGSDPDAPSPLVSRLAELMLFYVLRHAACQDGALSGMFALARRPGFAVLLEQMMRDPGRDWSTEAMARSVNMSRSTFYKHFVDACGQPPAQLLLLLRMKVAAQRLGWGESVERTAQHVGYQSHAAFTRAFKKVIGQFPGAFRRDSRERRDQDGARQLD